MHSADSSLKTTMNRSYPAILDITRLVSRVGRGPLTGVDRVELAYLDWCLSTQPASFYCLAKVAGGYVLLDAAGAAIFREKLLGLAPWGKPDWRAMVGLRTSNARGAAEADLRRLAINRSGRKSIPEIPIPDGIYFNTGHSNLSDTTLLGMQKANIKIATLIHDMIPLDWPQFQRDGTVEHFEAKMRLVAQYSDLVIANSHDTQQRVEHYFQTWSASPAYVAAHLASANTTQESTKSGNNRPYFVTLGTIEPRKNHALLLDIWEEIQAEMPSSEIPDLHIVGQRGWKNEATFKRLDQLKNTPWMHEHNNMDDQDLAQLLAGSHGLLFPSFAEGFGLPSVEAAQLGVPIICGDLAIHREVLGSYPVYAGLEDRYLWKKTILEQAKQGQKDLIHKHKAKHLKTPTWSDHFDAVNIAVTKLL